jgi:uncharacterized membrane protein
MLDPLAASADAWFQTLGRMHPAVVHFPIALLVVAGGTEFWRVLSRKRPASPTAVICLTIGTLASIVAVVLGLVDARYTNMDDVSIHQWLGIATAALATIVLVLSFWNRPDRANPAYRAGVLICAMLVSITGYYGGELTYGQGYLTDLIWAPPATSQPTDAAP